jgi:hypothetical protein
MNGIYLSILMIACRYCLQGLLPVMCNYDISSIHEFVLASGAISQPKYFAGVICTQQNE